MRRSSPTLAASAQSAPAPVAAGCIRGSQPAPARSMARQNRDARVVLRARGDAASGRKRPGRPDHAQPHLKAGDSYQVPNMPGVTLATSDARRGGSGSGRQLRWAGPGTAQAGRRARFPRSPVAGRPLQQSRRSEGTVNEHSRLSRHSPAQIAPDHGRQGAGRRRRADHGADHDQHHHRRRPRHHRPDPRDRGSRRRHRARLLSRRRRHQGDEGHHQGRPPFRSSPTSISTTSAPSRRR